MVEGPIIGESSHSVGEAFHNKVLEQMREWSSKWASMKAENMQMQKGYAKIKEEIEEHKDQYEDAIKKDFHGKKVIVIELDELDYIENLGTTTQTIKQMFRGLV